MYNNYSTKAYNLHIINTDKFKTITIKINFKKLLKKEDVTYRNLLGKVLLNSTKEYSTKQELDKQIEELYGLGLGYSSSLSGNYIISSFNCNFLNEKYTEKDMIKKSIEFLFSVIFNPNVEDNKFKYFDLSKRLVNDEIESLKDNTKRYSLQRLFEILGKNTTLEYNSVGYKEDLEKITNEDLYDYYKKMLKSDLIDIFVIGNVNDQEIVEIFNNKFNINTVKKPGIAHFLEHSKINKKVNKVIEVMPIEQTNLNIGFKLKDLTDFERQYVLYAYCFILGGGPNSKLFRTVREKNSLCYTISATHKAIYNILYISVGTNKSDVKKCISLIKKEINKMAKGDFEDNDLEAAKITYINSLKDIEDYQGSILRMYESNIYFNYDLVDERCEKIKNVTKDDIINLSKKIFMDSIFILEGESNEEN